ncbi:MAG TPA: glycerophosphodiester phosphodiesterase family protein [Terriglobia bacterium]|nr:glycerophosphodiester phosphodiesterase family protein [Terriglobia bacterium]
MGVLNIGHRGAAGEAPENTMMSFDLALRRGADGIELDVHLSSDGVPVVIHDPRLERTTSGGGPVSALPVSVLRRLDAGSWFNRRYPARARHRYAGLKIPTLNEVLKWVHRHNCLAFIEIKQGGANYPRIEEKVLEEIYGTGAATLATVISFSLPTLERVRQLDSRIALGLDFTRPVLAIRRACSIGAASLLPHWALATRGFIGRAHRGGFRVMAWDVNPPVLMRRKILDGVDGIITSHPARLAEVLRKNPQITQISQMY